jgi:hypothetical protein
VAAICGREVLFILKTGLHGWSMCQDEPLICPLSLDTGDTGLTTTNLLWCWRLIVEEILTASGLSVGKDKYCLNSNLSCKSDLSSPLNLSGNNYNEITPKWLPQVLLPWV